MNSMDFYMGKSIKRSVEDTGRKPNTRHWLVAAVLQANQEHVTLDDMIKMLNEINTYVPEKFDSEKAIRDLGF